MLLRGRDPPSACNIAVYACSSLRPENRRYDHDREWLLVDDTSETLVLYHSGNIPAAGTVVPPPGWTVHKTPYHSYRSGVWISNKALHLHLQLSFAATMTNDFAERPLAARRFH